MPTHNVALYARGHNAALAAVHALAGVDDSVLQWAVLRNGFVSYRHFVERPQSLAASFRLQATDNREQRTTAFDREIPYSYFPFGVLEVTDLPQLIAASRVKTILMEPIDGDWQPLSVSAVPAELRSRVTTVEEYLRAKW